MDNVCLNSMKSGICYLLFYFKFNPKIRVNSNNFMYLRDTFLSIILKLTVFSGSIYNLELYRFESHDDILCCFS